MGHTSFSGVTAIAPRNDLPITATTTSTYVSRVLTGYITHTMVSATSMIGSPVCPINGSGIAAIAGWSMTSDGIPWAPMSTRPTEGTSATMGNA